MKRNIICHKVYTLVFLLLPLCLIGSGLSHDYTVCNPWNITNSFEPTHQVSRNDFLPLAPEDSFVSYVYSYYSRILLFSYADNNCCRVIANTGDVVRSDTLMSDDFIHITLHSPYEPLIGIYQIVAEKRISVLIEKSKRWSMWQAVGRDALPLDTKILNRTPGLYSTDYLGFFSVFAYSDNTYVEVGDLESGSVIWNGTLDSAQYYLYNVRDHIEDFSYIYSVEASQPVSTMSADGLGGTYIPAYNGTFTGRDFITYQRRWFDPSSPAGGTHDLQVIPWEDNTHVTVVDLDEPTDTIWQEYFPTRGAIKGKNIPLPDTGGRALYIHSDKDISLAQCPWESYDYTRVGYFFMRGIDRDGLGLGKEFFLPLEGTVCSAADTVYSRLRVIAYNDNTEIKVSSIPKEGGPETTVWEGLLDAGDYYCYTCPSTWGVYHVTASEYVSTVASCRDYDGADFFPVAEVYSLGLQEEQPATPVTPVTPATHSVTHSSIRIITTPRNQVILEYSDMPQGLDAEVFDASGRMIDELHFREPRGSIRWGAGKPCGVYFIKPIIMNDGATFRVVLTK